LSWKPGVEGLVHVSEMSWTKKNVHPGKIVSTSQEVDVVVLDVDPPSAASRSASSRPWTTRGTPSSPKFPIGSTVEGEVKNDRIRPVHRPGQRHRRHGPPVRPGLERLRRGSHPSYRKGEMVKAKVLDVDVEKERVSLGIKQLGGDPMEGDTFKKGQQITVTVTAVETGGIEVKFGEEDAPATAFIRKSDLSRDRAEQRTERYSVGDRVDAMVTGMDKASRRVSVSIKALEMKDEKEAVEQFGSSDSGASLGDILGAALREKASTKE
jgi:small subunit ribosomal protein S1